MIIMIIKIIIMVRPFRSHFHRKSFSEGVFREASMAKALTALPKGHYV